MSDQRISSYLPSIRPETQTAPPMTVTIGSIPPMPEGGWRLIPGNSLLPGALGPLMPPSHGVIAFRKRRFPCLLDRHTRRRMQVETAARRRNEARYHYRDYAEFVRMDELEAAALRGMKAL